MDDPDYGAAEYLCYQVVRAVRDRVGQDLPKTEFNKQCYLVYKELQEQGTDAGLPVYWYEHGIMVDLDELVADFLDFQNKRWSSGTRGTDVVIDDEWEHHEFDIDPSLADQIKQKTLEVAMRFGNTFDTSVVKDETYEEYGNPFVQTLNEARYYIDELDDVDRVSKESYVTDVDISYAALVEDSSPKKDRDLPDNVGEIESDLLKYFDRLVETYPSNTYETMETQFRQWESISRQLAMNHMFSQLSNFTHQFWIRFSRGELRIEHNENIPRLKVHKWRRERPDEIEALKEEIQKYRQVLLENRESTDELESVSEEYSEAVDEAFHDVLTENKDV